MTEQPDNTQPVNVEINQQPAAPADASGQDRLAEQTDNSGEPGDDAPQGRQDVENSDEELDDDDESTS